MEKKLRSIKNWLTTDHRQEIIMIVPFLIIAVILEIFGIQEAVTTKNYFLLSVINYLVILLIMEGFCKKCFFKRLTYYLVKRPLSTKLVFFILGVSSIILSIWFFVAFLLCIPQAMIYGEFSRVEEEEKEKLSVLAFELFRSRRRGERKTF